MKPIQEIGLIVARELKKNLRGVKGIILTSLSLLGGTAVALLLANVFKRGTEGADPAMIREAQKAHFTESFRDADMGAYLADAPFSLVKMLTLAVWLAPALIWLAGFDAIAGEVQHRTIRYWSVRTRRFSYYLGKFLGLWATVGVMTFAMHLLMWIVTISQGASVGNVLSWGFRLWLVSVPIVGAWCGIAVLVGSLFRTPITSLLVVGFTFFGVFVLGAFVPLILDAYAHPDKSDAAAIMRGFYPNGYDVYLLSPKIERVAIGLAACFGFAGLPTALGAYLLDKKDV